MQATRWFALLVGLGCSPGPATTAGECDADCRVDGAVTAWDESADAGFAALEALPAPEEQLAVARRLLEQGQVLDRRMCDHLRDPAAATYCRELSHRPHLFEDGRHQSKSRTRAAGGPADTEMVPSSPPRNWATEATPLTPPTCESALSAAACSHQAAVQAARVGRQHQAARLCAAVSVEVLRSECRFASAEAAVIARGSAAVPNAIPMCLASNRFASHCLAHVISQLAQAAPTATATPEAWTDVLQSAAALRSAVAVSDPPLALLVEGRFFSETMVIAYRQAEHLDGRPLDTLPPTATTAVRDSLAWELVHRGELDDVVDLSAAIDILAQTEAARKPMVAAKPLAAAPPVRDRFGGDTETSKDFRATWWRGSARRPTTDDPTVDRALALLEASGGIGRKHDAIIQSATGHSDRIVAWSAARLSGHPETLRPQYGG